MIASKPIEALRRWPSPSVLVTRALCGGYRPSRLKGSCNWTRRAVRCATRISDGKNPRDSESAGISGMHNDMLDGLLDVRPTMSAPGHGQRNCSWLYRSRDGSSTWLHVRTRSSIRRIYRSLRRYGSFGTVYPRQVAEGELSVEPVRTRVLGLRDADQDGVAKADLRRVFNLVSQIS